MRTPAEEEFLKDVTDHKVRILHDDGVYRHLRFKRPNTGCMHFDIVTWPGYLAYSGDMGCYVFSRLNDMLEFFRGPDEGPLRINISYWAEKLQAKDGGRHHSCSVTEFSDEKFRRVIQSIRKDWIRESKGRLSLSQRRELWEQIDTDVLSALDDFGGDVARHAADSFTYLAAGR